MQSDPEPAEARTQTLGDPCGISALSLLVERDPRWVAVFGLDEIVGFNKRR